MNSQEALAAHALRQVRHLQEQGRSFDSIAALLTSWPLKPLEQRQDERIQQLSAELAQLRRELDAERAARTAAESVLADRCRELLELREAHSLSTETVKVLEGKLQSSRRQDRLKELQGSKPWWKI